MRLNRLAKPWLSLTGIARADASMVGLIIILCTMIDTNISSQLLQIGFINRTARGRIVTEKAYRHFGYRAKAEDLFTLSDQDE